MSADINVAFARTLLRMTMEDIKPLTTVRERKTAWVYHHMRDHWEFHGPEGYYWHGSADSAYDARAKGWAHWWEHLKQEGSNMRARLEGAKLREKRLKP